MAELPLVDARPFDDMMLVVVPLLPFVLLADIDIVLGE